ncbi:AMP binding protein [Cristinia sonorae]|uniref:AMP binding protein n=1 Tax=Cristinia sonorae TaxID=1940300 RepID=A0A8K0XL92_9AGAR|nr:AMP binding protein [Cristinia sonorae]
MRIIKSPYPDVSIPDESLFTYLFRTCYNEGKPTDPAFIDAATGKAISREQTRDFALRFAYALREGFAQQGGISLKRGDTIMCFSVNSISWPIFMYGAFAAGVKATLANSGYTARELEYQYKDSGSKMVVVHPMMLPVVLEMFQNMNIPGREVKQRVIIADYGMKRAPGTENFVNIDDLLRKGSLGVEEQFAGELAHEVAFICYSSGTTGNPKGVMTTHRNVIAETLLARKVIPVDKKKRDDVMLGVLPFYHIYGACNLMAIPFSNGFPVVVVPKFDIIATFQCIEKYRITMMLAVPPMFLAMARHPARTKHNLSTLRYMNSGAAPLGAPLATELRTKLQAQGSNCWITQGYGLTESTSGSHCLHFEDHERKVGTVGHLMSNMEARLVREDGTDAEVGEPGELWMRGPIIMKGYHNNPEANAKSFSKDGFFITGDVATIDEEGYFRIVDRVKELIKYKGFQVAPAELESLLLQHPDINDAAVIGIEDEEEATEIPRAYVVHKDGRQNIDTEAFARAVQKWIEPRVAKHKLLRGGVVVIDIIPKSLSGKILRRELKERAKTETVSTDIRMKAKL